MTGLLGDRAPANVCFGALRRTLQRSTATAAVKADVAVGTSGYG